MPAPTRAPTRPPTPAPIAALERMMPRVPPAIAGPTTGMTPESTPRPASAPRPRPPRTPAIVPVPACGPSRTTTQGRTDMATLPRGREHRTPDHPIEPLFLDRWSPRAMSGAAIDETELMRLFEAARWAPSTYNEQEWRFLYARRDSPHWPTFFGLLAEPNQVWCGRAAILMVVLSHKVFTRNGKPNPVHTFDTGAAFANLALQGSTMGL